MGRNGWKLYADHFCAFVHSQRSCAQYPFTDTFDFLLTRDLTKGHIIDFNPYAPRTDSLLFEYDELLDLLTEASYGVSSANGFQAALKVVDSRSHPAASRNAPIHQHNMVPMEALALSGGRNVEEFAEIWQEQLRRSTMGEHSDEES